MYFIPYLALVLFLGALAFMYANIDNSTYKSLFLSLGIVFFVFFFGFRGYIMSDWIVYHDLFYDCELRDVTDFRLSSDGYIEPGFTLFMLLCKSIYCDFRFFVFITTLINTALLLRFLKKYCDNILLCLVLFIVFDGLTIMVNLMRNSIAILIFLNSIEYLENRKPIRYFSLCFIAITFHISSLIYIPLYFFLHRRIPKWLFICIIVIFNTIYLLHIPVFASLMSHLGLDTDKTEKVIAYTQKLVSTSKLSIGYITFRRCYGLKGCVW